MHVTCDVEIVQRVVLSRAMADSIHVIPDGARTLQKILVIAFVGLIIQYAYRKTNLRIQQITDPSTYKCEIEMTLICDKTAYQCTWRKKSSSTHFQRKMRPQFVPTMISCFSPSIVRQLGRTYALKYHLK
jgi:hypothetical protein